MYLQSKVTKTNKAKWRRIRNKILSASGKVVQVGVFGDRYGPENNNIPVATVFRTQEYGRTETPAIPPRPAMREGLVQEMREGRTTEAKLARRLLKQSLRDAVTGRTIAAGNKNLKKSGEVMQNILKRVIRDWSYPPNAQYTQRLKGRDDPLVDTYRLHDSIKYRVKRK